MLMLFADFVSPQHATNLDATGHSWKQVTTTDDVDLLQPADGWHMALLHLPERGLQSCADVGRALRGRSIPVLAMVDRSWLGTLSAESAWFDDFALDDAGDEEIRVRITRLVRQDNASAAVSYPPVRLDPTTYQAWVDARVLDLTYMEYELLRWFVSNPDRVFSRADLLREVWKYEYYGGARTVDVHVRRLRSKIGRQHAHLIQTVRSVGYLFGTVRYED